MKDDEVKFGGTGQGQRNAEEVANHFACLIPTRVCRGSVRRGILRIKMEQLNLEGSWKLEETANIETQRKLQRTASSSAHA